MKLKTRKIFEAFHEEMRKKLEENNHKHPDNTECYEMFRSIRHEMDNLLIELNAPVPDKKLLLKSSTNIANFAMFIAYHGGKLLEKK